MSSVHRTICKVIEVPPNFDQFFIICQEVFNLFIDWLSKNTKYKKNPNRYEAEIFLKSFIRNKYPKFPTNLIQTIRDIAAEAYKSTRGKNPFKKSKSAIRYDKRTISLSKDESSLSFSWLGPRKDTKQFIQIPKWFTLKYPIREFIGANIGYSEKKKAWVANLIFKIPEVPQITQIKESEVCGIDRGIYQLLTTSDGDMFSSTSIRKKQREFLYTTRKLQSKGTQSARRKLKRRAGKQRQLTKDINHQISKKLVNYSYKCFVLEDLHRFASGYNKRMNKFLGTWAFYELETFISYKAAALGKKIIKVNPYYTSLMCNRCCHIDKHNRNGCNFECLKCHHKDHADINAAKNIKEKYTNPNKSKQPIQTAFEIWKNSKSKVGQAANQPAKCEVETKIIEKIIDFKDISREMETIVSSFKKEQLMATPSSI